MVRLPSSSSTVAAVVCAFALVVPEVASRHLDQRLSDQACRCFPGDACWPTEVEWEQFNQTLGGKLVATIPIAHRCHDSSFGPYDAEACAQLQSVWGLPETHYTTSSSPMAAFFANASCDPFTPQSAQCVIGTQIQYAVKASSAADYQAAMAFAQERNIRLVIRNTGHDFLGKSTGAGALGIWTHHLKDIQILDYKSTDYSGKAIKIGAGVQIFEAQAAAHAQGLAVVGGNCPSVGLAGGYTQGGGHGPLASTFGLAADQVLEWEVITATGEHLVATPSNNSDLYWALSGGGGGTFAAVLSMTAKAYPDQKVTSANLTFTSSGVSEDTFFDVVQTYLMSLPSIVDAGATSIWLLANGLFLMQPTTAPGMTQTELQTLLEPTLTKLSENSMPYDFHIQEFPTYLDSYTAMNPPPNVTEYNVGSRFIPRSLVASNDSAASLIDALRFIVNSGAVVSGVSLNVSRGANGPSNSINPVWRSTLFSAVFGLPYDRSDFGANIALQQQVTQVLVPKLEALTPNGGAYLNEADRNQPNFQEVFYGKNYARLRAIKKKYDPSSTFYALKAVGSEEWEVKSDGRLCKVE